MGIKNQILQREELSTYWANPEFRSKEIKSKELYREKILEILNQTNEYEKDGKTLRLGLETEFSLVTKDYYQASEEDRDQIIKNAHEISSTEDDLFAKEMGACQLEYRTATPPEDLLQVGFSGLENKINDLEVYLRQSVSKQEARLIRSGSNPFIPVDEIRRTNIAKYKIVPDFHDRYKRFPNSSPDTKLGSHESIEVQGADIIGITQAVQFSIDTMGFSDAIDKINRSLMISPYISGLCSNARFMDEKDSGYSDIRMMGWEISHDVRTANDLLEGIPYRVGLPGSYYININHYFERVSSFPFILQATTPEEAFAIASGIYWNDARIKFNFPNKQAIIEFRPISTQPSVREDLAAAAYYVGRMIWSQKTNEKMLDIGLVRENRYNVMKLGLDAEFWSINNEGKVEKNIGKVVLRQELKRAEIGLDMLGLLNSSTKEYIFMLEQRIDEGSPSDRLGLLVSQEISKGNSKKDALILAMTKLGMIVN